tara:strand:+ start:1117 stop:1662 length:546 start_codon:yes stop_codon:yes gene_type:complete
MIETSHSSEAMKQVRDYAPDKTAFGILEEMGKGMLAMVPPEGSSCVPMSALLAISLEEPLGTVIPVVAGALKLDGDYMYGSNRAVDGQHLFSTDENDWDGHCWLLFGDYIVDISLGRTARHSHCRTALAHRVMSAFGEHVGMIAVTEAGARNVGLHYLPRYVLTPDQVLANAGGALQKFDL